MHEIEIQPLFTAALSKGAQFVEIYAQQTQQQSLELLDGIVSQATNVCQLGAGIRVLHDEHTGYAYTMSFEQEDLMRAARFAATIAESGAEVVLPEQIVPIVPFEKALQPVTLDSSVLHRLEEIVYALDPRIAKVKAVLMQSQSDVTIVNSEACKPVRDHRQRIALMLHVVMEHDGKYEMGFASDQQSMGVEFITEERMQALARRAVSQAAHLFEAITPEGGEMPVVMAAGASGILLHEAIGHAFEADFIRQRTSIFTDRQGQQICRKGITIVDDATLPQASGSFGYDDEGEEAHCTTLVRDGRLESFLHDRLSAQHFGVAPTGNGRRQSFRHSPVPRMTNTYMLAGEASEEDVIRSVRRGIYAKEFTNGQVQIGAGDFTFFLKTGFLIEDGRLTRPIRDVNIIGNGPRALADISLVGNNLAIDHSAAFCGKAGQQVPVGQGLPTVLVDHLTVGGK